MRRPTLEDLATLVVMFACYFVVALAGRFIFQTLDEATMSWWCTGGARCARYAGVSSPDKIQNETITLRIR